LDLRNAHSAEKKKNNPITNSKEKKLGKGKGKAHPRTGSPGAGVALLPEKAPHHRGSGEKGGMELSRRFQEPAEGGSLLSEGEGPESPKTKRVPATPWALGGGMGIGFKRTRGRALPPAPPKR